jgi:hypothetical protein
MKTMTVFEARNHFAKTLEVAAFGGGPDIEGTRRLAVQARMTLKRHVRL